jgi:hypothetical protein
MDTTVREAVNAINGSADARSTFFYSTGEKNKKRMDRKGIIFMEFYTTRRRILIAASVQDAYPLRVF